MAGDWIWYGSAALLGLVGLVLGGWALLWDRARGRLRCPRCWYSMESIVPGRDERGREAWRCPECGHRTVHASRLRRTRKRWRFVGIGLCLALLGAIAAIAPRARTRGWLWPVPTRVLVELLPWTGVDGFAGGELRRRLGGAPWPDKSIQWTLSPSDEVMLLRRVAEGSAFARPIGARWNGSYGDLFRTDPSSLGTERLPPGFDIEARRGDYERAIDELRELPYEVEFSTRPAWVRGRSMSVAASSTTWWPNCSVFYRVRYQSADGSVRGELESNGAFDLPVPDVDHAVIDCEIEIMQKTYYASAPRSVRVMAVERRTFAFDTLADADAVLQALTSAGLDAYVAAALIVYWDGGFHASVPRPNAPGVAQGTVDVAFAGRLEVLRFGSVVARSEVAWIPRDVGGSVLVAPVFGDWEYAVDAAELGAELNGDASIGPEWSARFVSEPQAALKFLDAKRRWEGSVGIRFE